MRSGSLWRAADAILVELMQNQSLSNSEKFMKQWKQFHLAIFIALRDSLNDRRLQISISFVISHP